MGRRRQDEQRLRSARRSATAFASAAPEALRQGHSHRFGTPRYGRQGDLPVVGALLTVNRRAKFQYVQTNTPCEVISYDLMTDPVGVRCVRTAIRRSHDRDQFQPSGHASARRMCSCFSPAGIE